MINKKYGFFRALKLTLVLLAFVILLTGLLSFGARAVSPQEGMKLSATEGGIDTNNISVSSVIGKFVGALLAFVGVIFFILMIYGGFTWMIARGNEAEVTKAKDMITAAIIGLIIVLAAYGITKYIGDVVFTSQ